MLRSSYHWGSGRGAAFHCLTLLRWMRRQTGSSKNWSSMAADWPRPYSIKRERKKESVVSLCVEEWKEGASHQLSHSCE